MTGWRLTVTMLVVGFLGCLQNCVGKDCAMAGAAERAKAVLCPKGDVDPTLVKREAHRQLLHPALLTALIAHESGCRSKAVSGFGDYSYGQLRYGGSAARGATVAELMDPATNIRLTAAHLARVLTLCGGFSGLSVYSGHSRCRSSKYSRAVLAKFLSTFALTDRHGQVRASDILFDKAGR